MKEQLSTLQVAPPIDATQKGKLGQMLHSSIDQFPFPSLAPVTHLDGIDQWLMLVLIASYSPQICS